MVVSDPGNPANEGQIRLFKFGKKIFDKISEAIAPEFPDETPINPFDFWEGANFKLKIRQVEGYRNYDKSEFEKTSSLGTDGEIEAIWKKEYSLKEFTDPSNFKTYEQLKARLDKALGFEGAVNLRTPKVEEETSPFRESGLSAVDTASSAEDLDFFESLAKE